MISPDIDAGAARVHAAEESVREPFVGYGAKFGVTDRGVSMMTAVGLSVACA
jgi:hypothetical protein